MKRLLAFTLPLLALTALAYVGTVSSQYLLSSSNSEPTSSTAGIPLTVNTNTGIKPIGQVSVTVSDYSDGGSDEEFIKQGNGLAYIYRASVRYPDGGSGWVRAPQYDVSWDAGTVYTHGLSTVVVVPAGSLHVPGERLYYTTSGVIGQDAGTPVHNLTVTGTY